MTTEQMIEKLVSFFEDKTGAEQLTRKHLVDGGVLSCFGAVIPLVDFLGMHYCMHQKRVVCGTPHDLGILKFSLGYWSGSRGTPASISEKPNLDAYDRKKLEPAYVYRPK